MYYNEHKHPMVGLVVLELVHLLLILFSHKWHFFHPCLHEELVFTVSVINVYTRSVYTVCNTCDLFKSHHGTSIKIASYAAYKRHRNQFYCHLQSKN